MAKVLGIDLGAHTVKVAVFEGRVGKLELTDYRLRAVPPPEPVPLPELEEGETPPPPPSQRVALGARLAALGALLDDVSPDDTTVYAVALPADQTSLRSVTLPFSDRDRIAKTLPFELEAHVPFELDDFVLEYRARDHGEGSQVLCSLAPTQALQDLLDGLAELGVDPKHVVLDADVLGGLADGTGHTVQAVVDMGHARTLVSVVQDGEVLGVRAFSRGGWSLTQAIAAAMDVDERAAEGAKHVLSLESDPGVAGPAATPVSPEWADDERTDPHGKPVDPSPNLANAPLAQKGHAGSPQHALVRALEPVLAELRATLIALEDELGLGIDEVLLTGGTGELQGLAGVLREDLGVPVRRVSLGPVADNAGDPGRFALAHILGLKAAGTTGGRELSFRSGDFAFGGDLALVRNVVAFGLIALLMFSVVGTGLYVMRSVQYSRQIAAAQAGIGESVLAVFPDAPKDKLDSPKTALSIMTERVGEVTSRGEALSAAVSGEPPVLTVWKQLADAMPPGSGAKVDVTELTIGVAGISGKVETTSYEAAGEIEKSLQREPRFAGARKSNETKTGDVVRFDLSISLEPDALEEEEG